MSGDKLPPQANDCPRCHRSRILAGRKHCDSPGCTWVKCSCQATYQMYAPGSYHPADWNDKEPNDA